MLTSTRAPKHSMAEIEAMSMKLNTFIPTVIDYFAKRVLVCYQTYQYEFSSFISYVHEKFGLNYFYNFAHIASIQEFSTQ